MLAAAVRGVAGLALALLLAAPAFATGPAVTLRGARTPDDHAGLLRVCADPNNLPFSNARGEGFENALAELVGRELGLAVAYTWQPQRRGFVRTTIGAGACDVMMGVPVSFERVLATVPYYRSSYVFVTRTRGGPTVHSFDDAVLRRVKVGVQVIGDDYANTPPAHALGSRGIVRNVRGYTVYGDYAEPNPPARIIDAVARGEVDIAVAWGPLAGYFATREPVALTVVPVAPQIDLPFLPFVFDIGMGVRRGNEALRDRLDGVIRHRRAAIDALLRRYGVPRVDVP
jgi:mxaJ protein